MFAPSLHPHYRDFLTAMGSADFSQFVVTTANEAACETSTLKVHALSPHLPATFTGTSSNFWTSSLLADLSVFPSLICGSCTSGQGFAYSFLQIPPRDGHPCCSAMYFVVASLAADLSVFPSLICGSCSSGQGFAYSFLQIPPRDGHPCCSAMYFVVAYAYSGLSPVRARPWRANCKKAPEYLRSLVYKISRCYQIIIL